MLDSDGVIGRAGGALLRISLQTTAPNIEFTVH